MTFLIEGSKTLRQEIMEIDKRINNLVVYTVIATATIFGFGMNSHQNIFFFYL